MFDLLLGSALGLLSLNTEIQFNICDKQQDVASKLDINSWNLEENLTTYYVENAELFLYKNSWVYRIRIDKSKKQAEVTIKNNAMTDQEIATDKKKNKKCEYDLHGSQKKLACKISNKVELKKFEEALKKSDYLGLLNNDQIDWLTEKNLVFPNDLVFTSAFQEKAYVNIKNNDGIGVNITINENHEEFIEASVRAKQENENSAQLKLNNYLTENNIFLCEEQSAQLTRQKLESYFRQK